MNKPLVTILGTAAVVTAAVALVPSLRGPFNRAKISANEFLSDEFVVDNYKAEAISLVSRRKEVASNISRFSVQKRIAEKKLELAAAKEKSAKENLIATGPSDLPAFNRAREAYELAKAEVANLSTLVSVYSTSIRKLEETRALIDSNIAKCRLNVATLESKKAMADSLKSVNAAIENLQGIGEDANLGASMEKLDDAILTESIRIEALGESTAIGSREDAEKYLGALVSQQPSTQQQ